MDMTEVVGEWVGDGRGSFFFSIMLARVHCLECNMIPNFYTEN